MPLHVVPGCGASRVRHSRSGKPLDLASGRHEPALAIRIGFFVALVAKHAFRRARAVVRHCAMGGAGLSVGKLTRWRSRPRPDHAAERFSREWVDRGLWHQSQSTMPRVVGQNEGRGSSAWGAGAGDAGCCFRIGVPLALSSPRVIRLVSSPCPRPLELEIDEGNLLSAGHLAQDQRNAEQRGGLSRGRHLRKDTLSPLIPILRDVVGDEA